MKSFKIINDYEVYTKIFKFSNSQIFKFLILPLFLSFSASAQSPELKWIEDHLIPLKYVTAENGFDDMRALDTKIGDARIVAMGECTHGSSEIFSMKHRMLEYLVKEKGFTVFSIEANMPEAYELNKYILKGEGDVKTLMAGMYFWTWNTEEVKTMIEWMKKYNDTAANKIQFTGFDAQECRFSIRYIRNFLIENIPSLKPVIDDYDSCYRQHRSIEDIKKKKYNNQLKNDARIILDSLQHLKNSGSSKVDAWVLQHATLLLQFPECMKGQEYRDRIMAENAKWIMGQNPGARMMIWAHNEHVRTETNKFKVVRMGKYLREWYGSKLVSIAFASEEGTYTAVRTSKDTSRGLRSNNQLIPSPENSCESLFRKTRFDNFILDLRDAKPDDIATKWIFNTTLIRHLGAIAVDKFQFIDIQPIKDYDMMIFLRKTRASGCFWAEK